MELKINEICFSYDSREILKGISFEVSASVFLGIIGPNGAGKTTLLRCINNALKPTKGVIYFDGKEVRQFSRKEIAKNIGVVPQRDDINFPFSVYEIVMMGRFPHLGFLDKENPKDYEMTEKALEEVGIKHLSQCRIDEISGGEFQKVIIARALAQEPKVLLLDEPTLHLDINHQLEILEFIKNLVLKNDLVVIMVTHDLWLASRYCDSLLLIKEGKIHSCGKVNEVLTKDNIKDVYQIEVDIIQHPLIKNPIIIPLNGSNLKEN